MKRSLYPCMLIVYHSTISWKCHVKLSTNNIMHILSRKHVRLSKILQSVYCHDITEILLKVALNTITPLQFYYYYYYYYIYIENKCCLLIFVNLFIYNWTNVNLVRPYHLSIVFLFIHLSFCNIVHKIKDVFFSLKFTCRMYLEDILLSFHWILLYFLPSLGVHRLFTFHILILSSETA